MSGSGYPVYGANGVIGFASEFTHAEPTILIGCRGSIGNVHVTSGRVYATSNAMALDHLRTDLIELGFLARFLAWRGFRDATSGSSQPQLTRQNLVPIEVPVPPIDQQRRIAAILDQADALRAKRREVLARLDSLGMSIASEALSTALPRSSDAVLGDIADVITGFAFPSAKFVGEGIRLCRGANVLPGRIDWSDLRCWSSDEVGGLARFALSEGDIVLALDRPWITEGQKMARVSKCDLPSLLVQRVARIRASSEELQGLIWASLSSPSFQRYCRPTEP